MDATQLRNASTDKTIVTAPRAILPGQTYLVTRRCTQRQFLLTPTAETNEIVRYCLALATRQTGVILNAVCVMSNHWHGVVSDPNARLPQFLGRFHALLAKTLNASLGRWENLWSSEKASLVRLLTANDVIAKMAYTVANPTAAGIVETPEQWPGVLAWFGRDRSIDARKPARFFADSSPFPEALSVPFERPLMSEGLADFDFSRRLKTAIAELVGQARDELARRGLKFLGPDAVRNQSFMAVPSSAAVHRAISPTVASRSSRSRVQALAKKDGFRRAYRHAWQRFRTGVRDVKFPPGTYALRLNSAVEVGQK